MNRNRPCTVSPAVVLSALLALVPLSAANAAVITINDVIDISGFTTVSAPNTASPSLTGGPVTIGVGDSVDMTVNFTGGLSIGFDDGNDSFFRPGLSGASASNLFTIAEIQLTLLGFSGTGGASTSTFSFGPQSSGSIHMGPALLNFLTAGQSISFSGYHVTYDVTAMSAGPVSYANHFTQALNGYQTPTLPVPEPASVALLALGLAGLGFGRRAQASFKARA